MRNFFRITAIIMAVFCFMLIAVISYYTCRLPDSFLCEQDRELNINTVFNISAGKSHSLSAALAVKTAPETDSVTLKLMGMIPVKEAEIRIIDRPELSPCGKPFGIKMIMNGVMVIKTGSVATQSGDQSPAETAGIKKGDIIRSINDKPVYSNRDIEKAIALCSDEKLTVTLLRDGNVINTEVHPVCSSDDSSKKLGLWVRDSSSGIGTITYCDTETGTFGGLGHPVCDTDTGKIIPLFSGEIMNVSISGIKKGKSGEPGELHGFFCDAGKCGTLKLNNRYGVFGEIDSSFTESSRMPMALKHEIQTGEAVIYSTLEGCEPKSYSINIEKVDYNSADSTKNMIIRVTDPELIEKTGGIVQGMSGSPIIQNNMLIGAVTHVFVNNPEKGYAVFCENMYEMSHAS